MPSELSPKVAPEGVMARREKGAAVSAEAWGAKVVAGPGETEPTVVGAATAAFREEARGELSVSGASEAERRTGRWKMVGARVRGEVEGVVAPEVWRVVVAEEVLVAGVLEEGVLVVGGLEEVELVGAGVVLGTEPVVPVPAELPEPAELEVEAVRVRGRPEVLMSLVRLGVWPTKPM